MSVYSGFATRQQETFYTKLIEKLIEILQQKVLSAYQLTFFDERMFAKKIVKIHKTLNLLEKQKYLEPFNSYIQSQVKFSQQHQINHQRQLSSQQKYTVTRGIKETVDEHDEEEDSPNKSQTQLLYHNTSELAQRKPKVIKKTRERFTAQQSTRRYRDQLDLNKTSNIYTANNRNYVNYDEQNQLNNNESLSYGPNSDNRQQFFNQRNNSSVSQEQKKRHRVNSTQQKSYNQSGIGMGIFSKEYGNVMTLAQSQSPSKKEANYASANIYQRARISEQINQIQRQKIEPLSQGVSPHNVSTDQQKSYNNTQLISEGLQDMMLQRKPKPTQIQKFNMIVKRKQKNSKYISQVNNNSNNHTLDDFFYSQSQQQPQQTNKSHLPSSVDKRFSDNRPPLNLSKISATDQRMQYSYNDSALTYNTSQSVNTSKVLQNQQQSKRNTSRNKANQNLQTALGSQNANLMNTGNSSVNQADTSRGVGVGLIGTGSTPGGPNNQQLTNLTFNIILS
ncbi:UNKNOWN [Stylonychia lemnae]|uniref:Uncharacterized protein n=1 Tax=Stylonychia lemnae TaxID=5949 RepID=A0A078AFD5_STYLE|nr:UNKNOWN [Stylonychia lemnae]|eukprot:CDW80875.1 UNKNOWN [Stylonychia lemnae]